MDFFGSFALILAFVCAVYAVVGGIFGIRTRNALLRSLRFLGERGFALLTGRWRNLFYPELHARSRAARLIRASAQMILFAKIKPGCPNYFAEITSLACPMSRPTVRHAIRVPSDNSETSALRSPEIHIVRLSAPGQSPWR